MFGFTENGLPVGLGLPGIIWAVAAASLLSASLLVGRFWMLSARYRSVAASTDGRLLYLVEQDGSYTVLQTSDGQQVLHRANVGAVALLQANAGE